MSRTYWPYLVCMVVLCKLHAIPNHGVALTTDLCSMLLHYVQLILYLSTLHIRKSLVQKKQNGLDCARLIRSHSSKIVAKPTLKVQTISISVWIESFHSSIVREDPSEPFFILGSHLLRSQFKMCNGSNFEGYHRCSTSLKSWSMFNWPFILIFLYLYVLFYEQYQEFSFQNYSIISKL